MRQYALLFTLLLTVVVGSVVAQESSTKYPFEEKVNIINDSLKLTAWLMKDTAETNEPLIILLHQLGMTHESYQQFIDALMKYVERDPLKRPMPSILNFDLRGHGKSVIQGNNTLSHKTMKTSDFMKIPNDIKQTISAIVKDPDLGIDTNNIIVIGASIGANTAALLTEEIPGIKKIVLLSPGINYRGLEPGKAVAKFTGDILIMAGKGDEYSRKSTTDLNNSNKSRCTLSWFPGPDHGTEIINGEKKAMNELIDWVMKK